MCNFGKLIKMNKLKSKLIIAVIVILGITAFVSCEKDGQYQEKKNETELVLDFIQKTSSIEDKVKTYLLNKTDEDIERIKEEIANDVHFVRVFLQSVNITEEELSSLVHTTKELKKEIDRFSLTDKEIKMMLVSPVISTRESRSTNGDCAEFRSKRADIDRNFKFHLILCVGAAAGGGPLGGSICVAYTLVEFSQDMRSLEEEYPNCKNN